MAHFFFVLYTFWTIVYTMRDCMVTALCALLAVFLHLHGIQVCCLLTKWVYPVEVLHHLLGSKDEQHVLAAAASSSKQQQQASKKSLRRHRGSKPASK